MNTTYNEQELGKLLSLATVGAGMSRSDGRNCCS